MWDAEERRKYMELNNIDPYKVLNSKKDDTLKSIKKKYHKLALKMHPDKAKGASDLEFKILKECYLYIKDDLDIIMGDSSACSTLQELREQRNVPIIYEESRNLFTTNFEDPETRKKLFAVDDVPFSVKREVCTETNYANLENIIPENMFGKKKFNLKFFNEVFEAKKNLNKEVVVFKEPEYLPCQSSLNCGSIAKYDDVIIEGSNPYTGSLSSFKIEDTGPDLSIPQLKKIVKTMKKTAKKEVLEDVETLFSRKKNQEIILPAQSLSMIEASENLRKINLENTRDLLKRNKEYIKNKLHIYPENFRKNLNM